MPYCCGTATVSDSVVDGRLNWSLFHGCGTGAEIRCEREGLPDELRQAVLEQCGTYGIEFPDTDRVTVMRVLRKARELDVGELHAVLADGVTGTEAEMDLLRHQLAGAGVAVVVLAVGG